MEDHKHCEICGKVVGMQDRFCGDECVAAHEETVRLKKRTMTMWVVILTVLAILWQLQRFGVI